MTEEEKKTIERCKELIKTEHSSWIGITNQLAIETVIKKYEKQQSELEKKEKIIEELILSMAENHCSIKDVVREDICNNRCIGNNDWTCYKCIKQYFERKVK